MNVSYLLHATDVPIDPVQYAKHPIEKSDAKEKATFTVFPGAAFVVMPKTGSTDKLGIESIANGRKLLYFFVSVTYMDAFGRGHSTRVCSRYDHVAKLFETCPGNYDSAD
ncbi:MAG: hypothetical protein WCA10_18340 [Terracidiphilus sp.]